MARIMIENLFKRTIMAADHSKSLLRHFQDNSIDWMHACGAKGRCTTCKVIDPGGSGKFRRSNESGGKIPAAGCIESRGTIGLSG